MASFDPVPTSSRAWTRYVVRGALMASIWLGFNGLDGTSWIVGGPVSLAAAWLSVRLVPAGAWHWSLAGAIRFAGFFLLESLRGGWAVARQALSGSLDISPGFVRYPFHLPPGAARLLFCGVTGLLPGTAAVAIEGDSLCVHALDVSPDTARQLRNLERRVAGLFALAWNEREEAAP